MPRASLRSLLLICADPSYAGSQTQITGKPASANALYSHCDKGPASMPNSLNAKRFLCQNRKH
jgi:hypothetical protein